MKVKPPNPLGKSNTDFHAVTVLMQQCDVQKLPVLGSTLVIGRRTNVLLGNDSLLYLPENVTKLAKRRGQLFQTNAEDYFLIAFNNFPWHRIRDVIVGRPAYGNYLVGMAIKLNVTVVDATATLLAFHQTDKDGNYAGHRNKDGGFNRISIGQFNYGMGVTTSAKYATRYANDTVCNRTTVIVEGRYRARTVATRSLNHQVASANSTNSSRIRQVVSTPTRTHRPTTEITKSPKYDSIWPTSRLSNSTEPVKYKFERIHSRRGSH